MSDEAYRALFGDTPEEVAGWATEVVWLPGDRLTARLLSGVLPLDAARIERLGREGHLPRGADGLYPLAATLAAWGTYSRAAVGASARSDLGRRGAEERWEGDEHKFVLSCLQEAFREILESPEGLEPFRRKSKNRKNPFYRKLLAGALSDRLKEKLKDSEAKPRSERSIQRYLPRLLRGEELA